MVTMRKETKGSPGNTFDVITGSGLDGKSFISVREACIKIIFGLVMCLYFLQKLNSSAHFDLQKV